MAKLILCGFTSLILLSLGVLKFQTSFHFLLLNKSLIIFRKEIYQLMGQFLASLEVLLSCTLQNHLPTTRMYRHGLYNDNVQHDNSIYSTMVSVEPSHRPSSSPAYMTFLADHSQIKYITGWYLPLDLNVCTEGCLVYIDRGCRVLFVSVAESVTWILVHLPSVGDIVTRSLLSFRKWRLFIPP